MRSKENAVLTLFFNIPKHWRYEELLKKSKLSRERLSFWLKEFEKQKLIKRIKPPGKLPYYVAQEENPDFRNRKRLYALNKLEKSGLLKHLATLEGAKVVIVFGSFSRWDWYDTSDVDIFIYGKDYRFNPYKYQSKLGREIQIQKASNKKDLKKIDKMLPYIIQGDFIKGSIEDLGVEVHSKV